MAGYFTRPLQQVVFTGEIISASQTQPGTQLAFEGDDLASGTVVTLADKLASLSSQGSPTVVHLNSEPETCDKLKNSRLKEIESSCQILWKFPSRLIADQSAAVAIP